METYTESDGGLTRIFTYHPETSLHFKTERQTVDILDTEAFGRTLFIDGISQSSQKDEAIYHEHLVHPLLSRFSPDKPISVCILGGGEGATAREVLKWKNVDQVTMIDWDHQLIEHFKTKELAWHQGSFSDPRLIVETRDIFELFKEHRQYDAIIVDLTDPVPTDPFWASLIRNLYRWLRWGGGLVINAGGVLPWNCVSLNYVEGLLKHVINNEELDLAVRSYKVYVPSFGREWAFCLMLCEDKLLFEKGYIPDFSYQYFSGQVDTVNAWKGYEVR